MFTMSHMLVPGTICLRTRVQITSKTNRLQPLILGNMTWERTDNIIFLACSCGVTDRWGERWAEVVLSRLCLHLVDFRRTESAFHQHFSPSTSLISWLYNFTKHTKTFYSCRLNLINTLYIQRTDPPVWLQPKSYFFLTGKRIVNRESMLMSSRVIFKWTLSTVGYDSVILLCLFSNLSSHYSLADTLYESHPSSVSAFA